MLRWFTLLLIVALTACGKPAPAKHDPAPAAAVETAGKREPAAREKHGMDEATQIAALIDPDKLATLKERGANSRILKITAILWLSKNPSSTPAKKPNQNPADIVEAAVAQIGWGGTEKGRLTAAAILRNLEIAEELGATTPEDIAEMRRGQSPIVRRGPSSGDILSVDHIIPVKIAPELSNTVANLELMPLRLNKSKNDSIGDRQRSLARQLHAAGLLNRAELPN